MGKVVLGKEISKMTQEERNTLMAEWRARRKNGNGRLGYRSPDRDLVITNNFVDPNNKWKPGQLARTKNEHIKSIFVCSRDTYPSSRAYGHTHIYYIGFLTDSNRYSFEEFRDAPLKVRKNTNPANMEGVYYRIFKFNQMFGNKNIDKDTTIFICMDGIECKSSMYALLTFMHKFSNCQFSRCTKHDVLRIISQEYEIFNKKTIERAKKYNKKTMGMMFSNIYELIGENAICPWITQESFKNGSTYTIYKRDGKFLVELGLLYTVIMKFASLKRKAMLEKQKSKKEGNISS